MDDGQIQVSVHLNGPFNLLDQLARLLYVRSHKYIGLDLDQNPPY